MRLAERWGELGEWNPFQRFGTGLLCGLIGMMFGVVMLAFVASAQTKEERLPNGIVRIDLLVAITDEAAQLEIADAYCPQNGGAPFQLSGVGELASMRGKCGDYFDQELGIYVPRSPAERGEKLPPSGPLHPDVAKNSGPPLGAAILPQGR